MRVEELGNTNFVYEKEKGFDARHSKKERTLVMPLLFWRDPIIEEQIQKNMY